MRRRALPPGLPILSVGRHRRPRRGACLMEYTAVLAGERFTDAPACTDPVLAALARAINDTVSDRARQRLAPLAAALADAHGADDDVRTAVVRRCLLTALPHAVGSRRKVLLIALLGLDRAAAGVRGGFDRDTLTLDSELAVLGHDEELAAAADYVRRLPVSVREHRRRAPGAAVTLAVRAIGESAEFPDELLCRLLEDCLTDYRSGARTTAAALPASTRS